MIGNSLICWCAARPALRWRSAGTGGPGERCAGTLWLDKRYQGVTSRYAYEQGTRVKQDPFAAYRMIANDMLAIFNRVPAEIITIRRVAEMRFARDFASGALRITSKKTRPKSPAQTAG